MTSGLSRFGLRACAVGVGLLLLARSAPLHALTINLTFDSSVTSLPNAAQYEAATTYAAQQLEALFSDNITINIDVVAVSGTSVFGESDYGLVGSSYTQIRNALIAKASSANAMQSLGDLPATDPTGGGEFFVNTAEAKALGIIGPSTASDGTFSFGTGFDFALNPANRAVSGEYDFVGVAEHEITEVMGRSAALGYDFGDGTPGYIPYDLFRYSASGVRSLVAGDNNYFSIDEGATNLKTFNFPNGNGSDPQDWAPGTNDACNNAAFPGVVNVFSTVDITAMNVIGYTLAGTAPAFTDGPATSVATVGTPYTFTYTANPTSTFALASGNLPNGLTLSSGGVLSGTPTATGTFTGSVSATANGISTTQNFSIAVAAQSQSTAFGSWASQYFTAQQLNDATVSGPTATPFGDGVPNLLKYLFDINPAVPMTAQDRAALPILTTLNAGTTLALTYRQYTSQTGLTIKVQTTTDLKTWSDLTSTMIGADSVTHDPIMQAQVTLNGTWQFLRLSVSSP